MEKSSPIDAREMDETPYQSLSPEMKELEFPRSDDPLDPKNWSSTRKTLLFVSLMSSSLLADGYDLFISRRN